MSLLEDETGARCPVKSSASSSVPRSNSTLKKIVMSDSQRYPLKLYLSHNEEDIIRLCTVQLALAGKMSARFLKGTGLNSDDIRVFSSFSLLCTKHKHAQLTTTQNNQFSNILRRISHSPLIRKKFELDTVATLYKYRR